MSSLSWQIRQSMFDLVERDDGQVQARFRFPPDFVGFQGHFPGRPVLPAICTIQAVIAMLEARCGGKVGLREIITARFSAPIGCDEELDLLCSLKMLDERQARAKATIQRGGETVSKLTLALTLGRRERGNA
jgi:3-hydroxyacyl-[acyl-carrier-protein] dehydratase